MIWIAYHRKQHYLTIGVTLRESAVSTLGSLVLEHRLDEVFAFIQYVQIVIFPLREQNQASSMFTCYMKKPIFSKALPVPASILSLIFYWSHHLVICGFIFYLYDSQVSNIPDEASDIAWLNILHVNNMLVLNESSNAVLDEVRKAGLSFVAMRFVCGGFELLCFLLSRTIKV